MTRQTARTQADAIPETRSSRLAGVRTDHPFPRLARFTVAAAFIATLGWSGETTVPARAALQQHPTDAQDDIFPMAVWYGGGTARAPMLERDPRAKKDAWRKDLKQIRALGFNAIRCWIDWASGEPAPGRYTFDTIEVLLELAEEVGLEVIVQVYMDSAPDWIGRAHPDALFVSSNGQAIQPESSPGYCLDLESGETVPVSVAATT